MHSEVISCPLLWSQFCCHLHLPIHHTHTDKEPVPRLLAMPLRAGVWKMCLCFQSKTTTSTPQPPSSFFFRLIPPSLSPSLHNTTQHTATQPTRSETRKMLGATPVKPPAVGGAWAKGPLSFKPDEGDAAAKAAGGGGGGGGGPGAAPGGLPPPTAKKRGKRSTRWRTCPLSTGLSLPVCAATYPPSPYPPFLLPKQQQQQQQ
jgi:hypothetical protein